MPIYPYSFTLPPVNKQDIPSDGVVGEFLGISAGGVLDWLPVSGGSGTGDLLAANNLSELTPTAGTARTNLGLGTSDSPTFANLTLTSPSLSSSAPVTISQTWNQIGTAFTAFKVNATSTNSASGSLLLDLQVGGVSQFSVQKNGSINANSTFNLNGTLVQSSGNVIPANALILNYFNQDVVLLRDASNTLALRNGTSAQTFRVYNTFPGNGNNEYGEITWDASTLYFRPAATGTAAIRNTVIGSSGSVTNLDATVITFRPGGASRFVINSGGLFATNDNQVDIGASGGNRPRNVYVANGLTTGSISPNSGTDLIFNGASTGAAWKITPSGHFHAFADNAYDIGASGANRPRNVYAGTLITAPTVNGSVNMTTGNNGYGGGLNLVSSGWITNQDAGVIGIFNQAKTDAPFIVIGGTTAGFPAIKRNGAGLQIRLANDSANATLETGNLYASGNVGIGTTAPTAPLEVRGTAGSGNRESLLKCTVSDSGNDAFHIYNATSADNRFSPGFSGSMFSSNVGAVFFTGQTDSANDTGNSPLTIFSGRITSSQTDPNNGTLSAVTTRPLFAWWNLSTPVMQLNANGNLGIGTTSPTSKLHVAETWNAAGTTFAAAKVVVTDTASASDSNLLELWSGATPSVKLSVRKDGAIVLPYNYAGIIDGSANSSGTNYTWNGPRLGPLAVIGWTAGSPGGTTDTIFLRDEQYHLATRNGTNGQKFSVYGTYPGAAWERFTITAPTSGNVLLGTYKGTGGIARGLEFQTDGVTRMSITAAGTQIVITSGTQIQRNDGGGAIYDFNYHGVQFANIDGLGMSWSTIAGPASSKHVGIFGYASEQGVVQINSTVKDTFRDLRVRSVIQQPPATITPSTNGDLVVEATSNTTLTFKLKGTDGTVRSGTITLA